MKPGRENPDNFHSGGPAKAASARITIPDNDHWRRPRPDRPPCAE